MLPAWSIQLLGWGLLTVALMLPSLAWVLGWVRPPNVAPPEPAPVVTPEPVPVAPTPPGPGPTPAPPPTDTGCTPGLDDPPTGSPVGAGRTALAGTTAPLTLVALSGGAFTMGSADGEGDDDEHPRHRVCLAGFEISTHEVTNAQWKLVMDRPWPSACGSGCTEAMPVTNVSWQDAVRFANALSAREHLRPCYTEQANTVTWDPTCDGYRLPTEAEWEYATRAGTTGPYSFDGGEAELGKYAWFGFDVKQAQAVGLRAANPWGLFDVHGNVWEWVWDKYGEYSVGTVMPSNPAGPDVNGPATVDDNLVNSRVLRGGSFVGAAVLLRSAYRDGSRPANRNRLSGFRVARGPRPQP